MYVQTNRKIDERDVERYRKWKAENEQERRSCAKVYFGCLGVMALVACAIYSFVRADPTEPVTIECGFVIFAAILWWSMSDFLEPSETRNQRMLTAAQNGSAIERHLVASQFLSVETGRGHAYRKLYYFDIEQQGTIVVKNSDAIPNSDQTLVTLFDSHGREFDGYSERRGEMLVPVATFTADGLEDAPYVEAITGVESFTVLAEPFGDFLRRLEAMRRLPDPELRDGGV